MIFIILTTAFVLALILFLGARSSAAFIVRIAFLDDEILYGSGGYDALPSYDAMTFHPRYWLLWTKAQWVKAQA